MKPWPLLLLSCLAPVLLGFTTSSQTEYLPELLQKRHSGYSYDSSKSVSDEQIKKLIEAARTAPSSYNDQPWFFVISDSKKNPETYNKILNSLVEQNQAWAKNAPVLVLVVSNTKFKHNGKDNRWGPYDSGAAAFAMALEAADLGLMAHQMGGFDEKKIQKDLKIPTQYVPMAVMAIGYETEGAEVKAKERKPSSDNFFIGNWPGLRALDGGKG